MRVVLPELDRIGTTVDLEANFAAALATTNLVETRPEGSGRWRLLPNGRVGAVRVGGRDELDVQVLPKVGISRLLFLPGSSPIPASGRKTYPRSRSQMSGLHWPSPRPGRPSERTCAEYAKAM